MAFPADCHDEGTLGRDLGQPARCQRITVSGLRIFKASSTPGAKRFSPRKHQAVNAAEGHALLCAAAAFISLIIRLAGRLSEPKQGSSPVADQRDETAVRKVDAIDDPPGLLQKAAPFQDGFAHVRRQEREIVGRKRGE